MPGLNDWLTVARSADAEDLREHILTGYKTGKPFTPYVPTIPLPAPLEDVLDFGCGVGRSFPHLKTIARRVSGFDLPPMIERCRTLAAEPVDFLSGDWNEVKGRRFDLIVAALVLQHVDTEMCRSYLVDFARMAPAVYLLTRVHNDVGTSVFDLIAESGLFAAGECIRVEHDPQTHQLKAHGQSTFDEVRRSADAGHYEMRLTRTSLARA